MADKLIITSTRLPENVVGKLRHIAWYDRQKFQDTMEAAATEYIKKWEKKNGEISEAEIKKALGEK